VHVENIGMPPSKRAKPKQAEEQSHGRERSRSRDLPEGSSHSLAISQATCTIPKLANKGLLTDSNCFLSEEEDGNGVPYIGTSKVVPGAKPTHLQWKKVHVVKDGKNRFGMGLRAHRLGYEVATKEDHVSLSIGEIILACGQNNFLGMTSDERRSAMVAVLDDSPDSVWMIVCSNRFLEQLSDNEESALQERVKYILQCCIVSETIDSEWHRFGRLTACKSQLRGKPLASIKRLWQEEWKSPSRYSCKCNVTGHWKIIEDGTSVESEYIWFQTEGDASFCGYQVNTSLPCFGRVSETNVQFEVWAETVVFQATAQLRKHNEQLLNGRSTIGGCDIQFTGFKLSDFQQDIIVPWLQSKRKRKKSLPSRPEEQIEFEADSGIGEIGIHFTYLPPEAALSLVVDVTANSWAHQHGITASTEILEVNGKLPHWLHTWHDLKVQMQKRPLKLKMKRTATDID